MPPTIIETSYWIFYIFLKLQIIKDSSHFPQLVFKSLFAPISSFDDRGVKRWIQQGVTLHDRIILV